MDLGAVRWRPRPASAAGARRALMEPAGCHAPFLAPQPLRSARFPGRRFPSRNVPTHPSRDCRPKELAVTEPATHDSALSALLHETRQFEPAPELAAAANAQPDIYARAAANSGAGSNWRVSCS